MLQLYWILVASRQSTMLMVVVRNIAAGVATLEAQLTLKGLEIHNMHVRCEMSLSISSVLSSPPRRGQPSMKGHSSKGLHFQEKAEGPSVLYSEVQAVSLCSTTIL